MIFLDDGRGHWFAADSRREMAQALLSHLPEELDDGSLAALAAACLECEVLDVVVMEV